MSALVELKFFEPNQLHVHGEVDHYNVSELILKGQKMMQDGDAFIIDFHAVEQANSAGIALLTEWMRYSHKHDISLLFVNIPDQMAAMIELGGLKDILPLE